MSVTLKNNKTFESNYWKLLSFSFLCRNNLCTETEQNNKIFCDIFWEIVKVLWYCDTEQPVIFVTGQNFEKIQLCALCYWPGAMFSYSSSGLRIFPLLCPTDSYIQLFLLLPFAIAIPPFSQQFSGPTTQWGYNICKWAF